MSLRSDQREVAERLIGLLERYSLAALWAPTGWGKSYTLAYIVKSIGGKWLWAVPLISIEYSVAQALRAFSVEYVLSVGKERLCLKNYSNVDFRLRSVCMSCSFNVRPPEGVVNNIININNIDFGTIKGIAETNMVCPYSLQEETIRRKLRRGESIVVLLNHKRIPKFAKYVDFVVIDEAHSLFTPRVTRVPRRIIDVLFHDVLRIDADTKDAEVVKTILMENLLNLAASDNVSDLIDLNTMVDFVDANIVYYDVNTDEYVSVSIDGLPDLRGKKAIFMSATLPPSLLSLPAVHVKPAKIIEAKIPRGAIAVTAESLRNDEKRKRILDLLKRYLSSKTVIFTTESKQVLLDDATYEDELSISNICDHDIIVLSYFGKFSEGYRLTCFHRAILMTLPLLPPDVMHRLEVRGISSKDVVITKVIQSIGRLLPQDQPEIILLDRRFKEYCADLETYGIKCVEEPG